MRIKLTPEQERYLKENYNTLHDDVLAANMGYSPTTIYRLAKLYGLKRTHKLNSFHFTPEMDEYMRKHFPNTTNEVLGEYFGCSTRTVIRRARVLGVSKSKAFMKQMQKEGAAAAKYFNIKHGRYPPKGFHIPNRELSYFKPGRKESKSAMKKRVAKVTESRNATIAKERARLRAGLQPLTKMRLTVDRSSKKDAQARYYLIKKRGYIAEGLYTMLYDENTRRSRQVENRKDTPFKFKMA